MTREIVHRGEKVKYTMGDNIANHYSDREFEPEYI